MIHGTVAARVIALRTVVISRAIAARTVALGTVVVFRAIAARAMIFGSVVVFRTMVMVGPAMMTTAAAAIAAVTIPIATAAIAIAGATRTFACVAAAAASIAITAASVGAAGIPSPGRIACGLPASQQSATVMIRIGKRIKIDGCYRPAQSLLNRAWPHRLTIEPLTLCTCEAGSGKKKSDAGRNCQ